MVSCPSQNNFHQRDIFHLVSNNFSNEYSSMSKRKHLSLLLFSTIMEEIINNDNKQDTTSGLTLEKKALLQSLDPAIYGSTFLQKLHELMEFKNIHGSCAVPKRYKNNPALGEWVTITPCIFYFISRCSSLTYKRYILFTCFFLGNWVNKTRQMYRKYMLGESSSMTPERLQVLNDIGFIWSGTSLSSSVGNSYGVKDDHNDSKNDHHTLTHNFQNVSTMQDQLWMNQYQTLKEYWSENDQCYTNLKTSKHSSLSSWIVRQRREYQKWKLKEKTTMTKNRIELLESIGFDWSPRDSTWKLRIQELIEYKNHHGDCLVPVQYQNNPQLGRWVSTQRKYFKMYLKGNKSRITEEKIKQLSEIGFVWNRWEQSWSDNGNVR